MNNRHPLDTRLPEMFRSGQPIRAIFSSLGSAAIIEMCAYADFDVVIIDNEHGVAGYETTEHMLRAARATGIIPAVRCFQRDISRILDMGASAVQIPMVESAAEARDIVQQVRYPEVGRRGSAFSSRAAGYGAFPGAAHTQRSNEGIALIVMIETPGAVANAAEIAAVEGVDAVFVGPNDLSHAMGYGADWKSPAVQAAVEKTLRAVAEAGKCGGTIATSHDDVERFGNWGARYFVTVASSLITQALRQAANSMR